MLSAKTPLTELLQLKQLAKLKWQKSEMVVAKQQLFQWHYVSELRRHWMKLVGRDVEMNQVRQVGNVSWQSDELIVSQVKLCQVTKVPQWRAQVCDTPYITHTQSLTIQCHIITYQYSTPGNCVRSFYSYHVHYYRDHCLFVMRKFWQKRRFCSCNKRFNSVLVHDSFSINRPDH